MSALGARAADLQLQEIERPADDVIFFEATGKLKTGDQDQPDLATGVAVLPANLVSQGWHLIRRGQLELSGDAVVLWEELTDDRYEVTLHIPHTGSWGKGKSKVAARLVASTAEDPAQKSGPVEFVPRTGAPAFYSVQDALTFRWRGTGELFRVEIQNHETGELRHRQQVEQHGIALPVQLFEPNTIYDFQVSQADSTLRFGPKTSLLVKVIPFTDTVEARCRECSGNGVRSIRRRCSVCSGKGEMRTGLQSKEVCGACRGTGEIVETQRCLACGGDGVREREVTSFVLEEESGGSSETGSETE